MSFLCQRILRAARRQGAIYVEAREVLYKEERFSLKETLQITDLHTHHLTVRALADGDWGYASTTDLSRSGADRVLDQAISAARAAAALSGNTISAPSPQNHGSWETPFLEDPFELSLDSKIDRLKDWTELALDQDNISLAHSIYGARRWQITLLTTSGVEVTQIVTHSGAGITLGASSEGELQIRSFPNGYDGQWISGGFEALDNFQIRNAIPILAEEATQLLHAPTCPTFNGSLIIGSRQAALHLREGFLELLLPNRFDPIDDYSANLHEQVASPYLDLVTDEHLVGGLASQMWDDTGQPLLSGTLLTAGRLVGFGPVHLRGKNALPIRRYGNAVLQPKNNSLSDLIADIERGIYMETPKIGLLDRGIFSYQCEIGWLIENGEITSVVKNPLYSGEIKPFWHQCDAVGDPSTFGIWSIQGRAQKGRSCFDTTIGAPALRFTNVQFC